MNKQNSILRRMALFFVFSASVLFAQEPMFQREVDTIPVMINGVPVSSPFAGGLSYSKPAFTDIDNDGDFDLFVGENDGNLNFYRNDGTAANPAFIFVTKNFASIDIGFYSVPAFADIDNDGDFDLLVGEFDGNLNFYRNTGTAANPVFTLVTDNFASIDVGSRSTPTFTDIDNDGDFDLFVGTGDGNIKFYRNTGTATNFSFSFLSENFASINVGFESAPSFVDIDNDGDFDLFVGENDGNINFYRNDGSATNSSFTLITENFASIDVRFNSAPTFVDIDNDGDFDLFVGNFDVSINFYRNTGNATNPAFMFVTKSFAFIFDIGLGSVPNFADIDNDGDFDLFVGENEGNINFYRNDGTTTNPAFTLVTDSLASIDVGFRSVPSFADIDNDGDVDLFVGNYQGIVNFYLNTGTAINPSFTLFVEVIAAVGSGSFPTVADIDDDSDFDLFVGGDGGNIKFYRNTGTATNPAFTLVTENFASINVGSHSAPSFADIDKDGDFDLFVGEFSGNLNFYRTDGAVTNPAFILVTENFASINIGFVSAPTFVDIDNDGDLDLFVGENDGGLHFYRNVTSTTNRNPVVANAIPNQTLIVGGAAFTRNLNASPAVFNDPDGDALTYIAISSATNIATASISGSTLTVAPVAAGSATITVTANDGRGGTTPAAFTVTVGAAANRPPMLANAISNQTLTIGGAAFTRNLNASPAVFNDPDGDALTYTASSSATNIATASISGSTLTVTPAAAGSATITVTANDGRGGTVPATFTVTVGAAANRPPMVANAIFNQTLTVGGAAFTRNLNASPAVFNDPDGDVLTYAPISNATNIATASISGSTLTVTPVAAGSATITVTANDGRGGTVPATFTVTVMTSNRAPMIANAISNQTLTVGGASFTRNLNASPAVFTDPDGDALTYTASSSATNIATASLPGSTLTVAPVAVGSATITITANDGRGETATTSFTASVRANQPPAITHAPASVPQPENQPITIQTNVTDDAGNLSVQLSYRRGGETGSTTVAMTVSSGNTYQASIPASFVTARGVEYFVTAIDADNASTRKPEAANSIFSIAVQVSTVANPNAQPGGNERNAYRLISVPLQLGDALATAVLEDDLGKYINTVWRLFSLVVGQPLTNKEPYIEVSQTEIFRPGKSLFLIVKDPGKTIKAGPGQTLKTEQLYKIRLEPGHNFVANPFNFTIPASHLRKNSGQVILQTYTGSTSFTRADAFLPWEGYYLANNEGTADTLFVNPNLSSSSPPPVTSKTDGSGWRLQIVARCGQVADLENFAGVAATSADGWDDNDLVEPPPIGEYVSVYFPHSEWQKVLSRYCDDMRSPANPNQEWRFVVETNLSHEMVTLRFDGLKEIDPSLAVFLVDDAMKYKQNLRENAVYQYQSRQHELTKPFTLVVGKENFVSEQTTTAQGVPEDFVLEPNFPNPFPARGIFDNPETAIRFGLPEKSVVTLKIFDVAGHEIATLLERVELPAGRHQRVWDGRDAQGRAMTSGIYFCRLAAGNFSRTMKMMLMR